MTEITNTEENTAGESELPRFGQQTRDLKDQLEFATRPVKDDVLPDEKSIETIQESNMAADNAIKMTFSIEIHTYYPAWRKPVTGATFSASPLDDKNKAWSNSYAYTNSSFPQNDIILYPRKVKWYNQINEMRQREKGNGDDYDTNLLKNPQS